MMTLLTVHACSSLAFGALRHLCTHIYSALFENGGVRCHLLREVPYGWLAMILMYASPGGSEPQPWRQ